MTGSGWLVLLVIQVRWFVGTKGGSRKSEQEGYAQRRKERREWSACFHYDNLYGMKLTIQCVFQFELSKKRLDLRGSIISVVEASYVEWPALKNFHGD